MRQTSRLAVATVGVTAIAATVIGTGLPAQAAAKGGPVVVATGLSNPRQITLLGSDRLYIAETGRGGTTCAGQGDERICIGTSGAVALITNPRTSKYTSARRIVTGLISVAGSDGSFAGGASGVATRDSRFVYSPVSWAPPAELPPNVPTRQLGKLLKTEVGSRPLVLADIARFDKLRDPDRQGFDSNPYAALALRGRTLVSDAAGNAIYSVNERGTVHLFKVLPNIRTGECGQPRDTNGDDTINQDDTNEDGTWSCDAVPTSLTMGPDGYVYVGLLAAEVEGEGRVWKMHPQTGRVLREWTGFTTVTGVAVGPDGSLYVSQLFANFQPPLRAGLLTKVPVRGKRIDKDVPFPAGVAVDSLGNVYVAAYSIAPHNGLLNPASRKRVKGTAGQIWRFGPSSFAG